MNKGFKNALCGATVLEAMYITYWHHCRRHLGHEGVHRASYQDGMKREWNTGEQLSVLHISGRGHE